MSLTEGICICWQCSVNLESIVSYLLRLFHFNWFHWRLLTPIVSDLKRFSTLRPNRNLRPNYGFLLFQHCCSHKSFCLFCKIPFSDSQNETVWNGTNLISYINDVSKRSPTAKLNKSVHSVFFSRNVFAIALSGQILLKSFLMLLHDQNDTVLSLHEKKNKHL